MGYPKEIYEKAWQILDDRREEKRAQLRMHQEKIRQEIPEITKIQNSMMKTGTSITRSVIVSPDKAGKLIEELARENSALQERRRALLVKNGFSEDYLEEKFFCDKCSDSGYIGTEMCDCFGEILKQQAFSQLNMVADGNKITFNSYSLEYYSNSPDRSGVVPRQRMSEVLDFCKNYAHNFSENSQSLLMMGRTGLGKTHLSLAIAWEVITQGFGVVYTPIQRLMDKLEALKFSYSQDSKEAYAQSMNSVMECDLLVLDDLGTEFLTSFTTSVLYNIVNSRLAEGKPTIINTNMEPVELEKVYSQRMASRLGFGYKVLRFYGEDIRYIKRESRFRRGK